ncbi:MAG: CPBP family intramembrane metalloprotease [Firmicutes bacterium]|nr:CPBP family intramembrane metalloprotease [Bacillota bacterium]
MSADRAAPERVNMMSENEPRIEEVKVKEPFDHHNLIIWILLVTAFWYLLICSLPGLFFSRPDIDYFSGLVHQIGYMPDAMNFAVQYYLMTLPAFVIVFLYTGLTKRNRFIFRSFLPIKPGRTMKMLLAGLLVGFIMNFACIVCAMINGDIHLFLNFALNQIPFYFIALVFVFIQSSSEELWTRGFMYERINVRYPLWVAILVNGVFFGMLHCFNDGATVFAVVEIAVCGVSFSLAKWYTGSIWFPAGIHTAWNFTQNFLFGLPNSGLVSEASVFGLDAATARSSMVYSVPFGVEGAIPALVSDGLLGLICLILAIRQGRAGELLQRQVTPRRDPEGPQPLPPGKRKAKADKEAASEWHYENAAAAPVDAAPENNVPVDAALENSRPVDAGLVDAAPESSRPVDADLGVNALIGHGPENGELADMAAENIELADMAPEIAEPVEMAETDIPDIKES